MFARAREVCLEMCESVRKLMLEAMGKKWLWIFRTQKSTLINLTETHDSFRMQQNNHASPLSVKIVRFEMFATIFNMV